MNDNIREWIQKSPNTNREKLCKKFEDDNGFAYKFAEQYPEYQSFIKYFITES